MRTQLILDLRAAALELHQMANDGKAAAARDTDPNRPHCRVSDEAVAQYEATAKAIDNLTARFKGIN